MVTAAAAAQLSRVRRRTGAILVHLLVEHGEVDWRPLLLRDALRSLLHALPSTHGNLHWLNGLPGDTGDLRSDPLEP